MVVSMTFQILISLAFLAAVIIFALKSRGNVNSQINIKGAVFILLGFALVLRLVVGFTSTGYETDIGTFKAWGAMVNDIGYSNMYSSGAFLDYPPGYLYILGWLDSLRGLLSIESGSQLFSLMIKLPSIFADLVCGYLIYRIGKTKIGQIDSLLLSAIYLFCPAVLINSTVWGQADSFTTMLLLISLMLLYKDKIIPAAVVYGLGVISKPQILIFAPIYLFCTIKKKNFKGLILGVVSAVLVIMLVATPFIKDWDYLWLIGKYKETMDFYSYYTVNAYNLWGMVGMNWAKLPESGVGLFLLNWAGPVIATVLSGIIVFRSKRKDVMFICPAILMGAVYIFSVKMHERYLFPILLFLLLTYIFTRDRRFLWIFGGFSLVHYINVAYVLHLDNSYLDPLSIQIVGLSAAHLLLFGYMMYVIYRVFVLNDISKFRPEKEKSAVLKTENSYWKEEKADRSIGKADLIIVGIITVAYGIVAFWNLGVNISANTSWTPAQNESVVFAVDGSYSALTYLPGIAKNEESSTPRVGLNIKVETSADGESWLDSGTIDKWSVYAWTDYNIENPQKFVRITALDAETTINEVGFKGADGQSLCTFTPVSGNTEKLVDEQSSVPLYPSYLNSTYFDEIYHARTAYEHILGVEPYENTHPTLGKLIISSGILMFGMNPFGWRFMGTLFGVLMLPVLYHLLKRLFGNRFLCGAGTILFAFDFMHFTQTRIATIDTYAVFFLLIMYDAMVVFIQKDIIKTPIRKLLAPLAVSGIFMGIGVASKWTAAYGAIGLAVLFFGKLIISRKEAVGELELKEHWNKCLTLCMWCLLLFLIIPFGIYFAAFLPITTLPQNIYNVWDRFLAYQNTMFSYHSKLVAEHYFASPWYEWPLDLRNIWYFSSMNVDGTGAASTIVCLGNPILWWSGLLALIAAVVTFFRERTYAMAVAIVGFGAVYLPWVMVPRLTFVYHYFTAVPFIIIALLCMVKKTSESGFMAKSLGTAGVLAKIQIWQVVLGTFVVLNLIMFAVFYPALSGAPSTKEYIDSLEWLPNWYFL